MGVRAARIISILFHPVFLPLYLLIFLFSINFYAQLVLPMKAKFILAGIVAFTTILMPLLMNGLYLRMKLINSLKMETREERVFPIVTQAIFLYLTYYLLKSYHIPFIFSFYMLGATFLVLIALVITIFYKISLHMLGMGGVFGFLTGLAIWYNVPLTAFILLVIILSGIVGTARLKANSHKNSEIYSGFLVGTFGMMLLFYLL